MKKIAVYALTMHGAATGRFLADRLDCDLYLSARLAEKNECDFVFGRLADTVKKTFCRYQAHVFITAAGIAVRSIATCIRAKDTDPGVVVMDQMGRYCISLVGGHLGGANDLARQIARLTGGRAVITTATDSQGLPSIDMLAMEMGMAIGNMAAVKHVNAAIIERSPIQVFDPEKRFGKGFEKILGCKIIEVEDGKEWIPGIPGIWVDWKEKTPFEKQLILNPKCLVAGIGCNRGTAAGEITGLVSDTLKSRGISPQSIRAFATIDIKKNEAGLMDAAESLNLPLVFFSARELESIDVPNPSDAPGKYVGVRSVCEAAAILATRNGKLIIPKIKGKNVTLAVALEA